MSIKLEACGIKLTDQLEAATSEGNTNTKSRRKSGAGGVGTGVGGPGGAVAVGEGGGKEELESLFQNILEERGRRKTMDVSGMVTSEMFEHQKEALAWMVERENSNRLPPFWERKKGVGTRAGEWIYFNTLTNSSTTHRPPPVRGGILADDMVRILDEVREK